MLAAMATHAKQLETAEVAYAAINEADKVIPIEIQFEKALYFYCVFWMHLDTFYLLYIVF